MKAKIEIVEIKNLQTNLFVRKELDQDRVLYLAELLENGVVLDPIEITSERMVIDGRHRIEAYQLLNKRVIEAKIVEVADEIDLIAKAYKANVGGALPPSSQDTEHTVVLLLERGEPKNKIGKLLGLPMGMARRYINDVQSKLARAKLQRAAAAIIDGGLTLAKAAEQYDVEPDKLKEVISGHRRDQHKVGVVQIRGELTRTYKSLSSKNAALMRSIRDKYEDGDVTEKQVREILNHIKHLQKLASKAIVDWEKRLTSINGKPAELAVAS